jgi:hypothetical protein
MATEHVLFRITRPNTSVFPSERQEGHTPVQTGGVLSLPKAEAEYHVRNGVGEIVTEDEKEAEEVKTDAQGEPKTSEEPKAPAKRAPGRPAAAK